MRTLKQVAVCTGEPRWLVNNAPYNSARGGRYWRREHSRQYLNRGDEVNVLPRLKELDRALEVNDRNTLPRDLIKPYWLVHGENVSG